MTIDDYVSWYSWETAWLSFQHLWGWCSVSTLACFDLESPSMRPAPQFQKGACAPRPCRFASKDSMEHLANPWAMARARQEDLAPPPQARLPTPCHHATTSNFLPSGNSNFMPSITLNCVHSASPKFNFGAQLGTAFPFSTCFEEGRGLQFLPTLGAPPRETGRGKRVDEP